jgi:hypothetical protein
MVPDIFIGSIKGLIKQIETASTLIMPPVAAMTVTQHAEHRNEGNNLLRIATEARHYQNLSYILELTLPQMVNAVAGATGGEDGDRPSQVLRRTPKIEAG